MANWQNQHRDPFGAAFTALFQQAGARRVSGFDRPSPPISMLISTRVTSTWASLPKSYGGDGS